MKLIYQRRNISPKAECSGNKARRLFKSLLRCSVLPALVLLAALAAGIQTEPAQALPLCPNTCDSVSVHDTSSNCFRFFVQNRKKTGLINRFRVYTTDYTKSTDWICTVSTDPIAGYTGPMWSNTFPEDLSAKTAYSREFYDPSAGDTASLAQCDSGYITLCLCCPQGSSFTLPVHIVTYHVNAGGTIVDSCDSGPFNLTWTGATCRLPIYACKAKCDDLSVTESQDPHTGESRLCVTVTRNSPGSMYSFDLGINCNASDPRAANNWRVVSMPPGWSHGPVGSTGASFVASNGTAAIKNCASATFCLVSENCFGITGPVCDNLDVTLTSESDSGICSVTKSVTLTRATPNTDTGCCASGGTVYDDPPTLDNATGVWTYCMEVHRSDQLGMNTITINHISNRKLCIASIPAGWVLQSSSGGTDVFVRTTADTLGCRTFEFCYQTCDCWQTSEPAQFTVSGENLAAAVLNPNFGRDGGICCNGKRYLKDHAAIIYDPVYANCLIYRLYNTNEACTPRNDFHFTLPPGCTPSSILVPPGYAWNYDPVTMMVDVVPAPHVTPEFYCCDSLSVQVCFGDCIGPWTNPFIWQWSSTYNGVVVDAGTETYPPTGPVPPPPSSKVMGSSSHNTGEPSFPNPFGASSFFKTTVPFTTEATGIARIAVTDATGSTIFTEDQAVTYPGQHFFYFSGEKLPSGTYYYRIEFPKGKKIIANRTMILVK